MQSKSHDGLQRQQVHLTGVLAHGQHRAWAFLSGNEIFHDSNLTVECLQRVLIDITKDGPLPRKLYIQLDNCGRYALALFEIPVSLLLQRSTTTASFPTAVVHPPILTYTFGLCKRQQEQVHAGVGCMAGCAECVRCVRAAVPSERSHTRGAFLHSSTSFAYVPLFVSPLCFSSQNCVQ